MIELKLSIDTKAINQFALLTEKNLRYARAKLSWATVLSR
jgi:DNA polymerase III delta subunit